MRVVYKNKYVAIRNCWSVLDRLFGISRTIAALTLAATLWCGVQNWCLGIATFCVGVIVWSVYAIATRGVVNRTKSKLDMLVALSDTVGPLVNVALYELDEKGKYTLGIEVGGVVYKAIPGSESSHVTIDCVTQTAEVSNLFALVDGRVR